MILSQNGNTRSLSRYWVAASEALLKTHRDLRRYSYIFFSNWNQIVACLAAHTLCLDESSYFTTAFIPKPYITTTEIYIHKNISLLGALLRTTTLRANPTYIGACVRTCGYVCDCMSLCLCGNHASQLECVLVRERKRGSSAHVEMRCVLLAVWWLLLSAGYCVRLCDGYASVI